MTAKELIVKLQALPPDTKIVVRGYEDGYNDIKELNALKLKREINSKWYYGEYSKDNSQESFDAIELFGEKKDELK